MEDRGPVRLSVRTSDFHSGKRGSIPLRATEGLFRKSFFRFLLFFFGDSLDQVQKLGTSTKSILFIEPTGHFLIAKKNDSNVLF